MPRLPRFKRSPNVLPIRLTSRDRQILRQVHRHRFLRSSHITSLLPGSRQQTLRRLQLLYHHGYLERPRCQIDYYHQGGSHVIAYGLGNKGAWFLKREFSLPYQRFGWLAKQTVQRVFLEHALMVSDVMVAVELACRNRPRVRLLSTNDMPDGTKSRREPFQWKVDIGRGRICGVVPDHVFGLEFPNKSKGWNQIWFCLEADRGTTPITRSNPDQSSIHRKFLAYAATWSQQLHLKHFDWPRFRVLTVTTSPERREAMRAACRSLKRGQGLFLFCEAGELAKAGSILDLQWSTCGDGKESLLD